MEGKYKVSDLNRKERSDSDNPQNTKKAKSNKQARLTPYG
jgi:hypothetical protein